MSFRVHTGPSFVLPMYVKPQIFFSANSAKIDISVNSRLPMGGKQQVEGVRVYVPMPMVTSSVNVTVNHGSFDFDPVSKMLRWDVGRIPREKVPMMSGNAVLQQGYAREVGREGEGGKGRWGDRGS